MPNVNSELHKKCVERIMKKHPLREGIIKRIHVNQHNIKANRKAQNSDLPVITIKTSKENIKCNRIVIRGPSELVYDVEHPLSCGATLWIETKAQVVVY